MLMGFFRLVTPLLLGAAALLASPASAQTTNLEITSVTPVTSTLTPPDAIQFCVGYGFADINALQNCVVSRTLNSSVSFGAYNTGSSGATYYARDLSPGTGCTAVTYPPQTFVRTYAIAFNARGGNPPSSIGGSASLTFSFLSEERHSDGRTLFSNALCTQRIGGNVGAFTFWTVNVTRKAGTGGTTPPTTYICKLNALWSSFSRDKLAVGATPANKAYFNYFQAQPAMPAFYTDGHKDGDETPPGSLFSVDMGSANNRCFFRRDTRTPVPNLSGGTVDGFIYTAEYVASLNDAPGDGISKSKPSLPASTTKSKPAIPYGTPFSNGEAKAEAALDKLAPDLGIQCGPGGACYYGDGQPVAVEAKVTQQNPQVPYVHPAPNELVRDNPQCASTFDPRCAWNPSTSQPAQASTPPEQLIRLSNDGQTIVHNSRTVYNNTVYPNAMRDAGTAPNNMTPGAANPAPGSTGDPSDPEDVDGDGAGVAECASSAECGNPDDDSVKAYIRSVGADPNKDQSAGGVAGGVLQRAVANGKCSEANHKNPFCQLAAGFGMLKSGEGGSGPLVYWQGVLPDGKMHQASINGDLISALDNILAVFVAVMCWWIILRGKPL